MNLLDDNIEDIAQAILAKIAKNGGTWSVFAKRNGVVAMDQHGGYVRKKTLPDSDMVGRYRKTVQLADLIDDLRARRAEINFWRAA